MTKSPKNAPPSKRIDWPAAKTEYINNAALTYADIAKKYGTKLGSVQAQAATNNWTEARAARSKLLQQRATEKSLTTAVDELAKYNEQDLLAAKALRSLIAKRMHEAQQTRIDARDLRSLAGAMESVQRVARLALGASTENADTRISEADRLTPEERRERIRQLHAELFPTVQ